MAKKLTRKARRRLRVELKALKAEIRFAGKRVKELEKKLKRKMRAGGGRSKGNSFERVVAKRIVHTFKKFGIRKTDCYRTPLSGGHRYAKGKDPGDLVISKRLAVMFPFSVECKHYKFIYLSALWYSPDEWKKAWKFGQWLEQTCKACTKNRHPLLVFKGNNTPIFCMLPRLMPLVSGMRPRLAFDYKEEDWCVVLFEDLLNRLRKEAKYGS